MSDRKKETMFAKLAQQHAKANPEEAVAAAERPAEDIPPSPAPPEAVKAKPHASRRKVEAVSGKRGNPDYCQANAYVPKAVRKAVDKALLDIDGLDYSSLVTDLLRKWLKGRGVSE
jgi:hypothetical protein